jgi:hypothetical protein
MEYYSVIKKNKIMSFAGKWMKVKDMLNKIRKTSITCFLFYVEIKTTIKKRPESRRETIREEDWGTWEDKWEEERRGGWASSKHNICMYGNVLVKADHLFN